MSGGGSGNSGKRPSDRQRRAERAALKTPPPDAGGGFDVKPSHLYYVSHMVRDGQFDLDKAASKLVTSLEPYKQSAGTGAGAGAFSAAYEKVAKRFLEVWARGVVGVGGAAVGLTVTANNYAAADWHTNQKMHGPPPRRDPPAVIEKPPVYGPVPSIKWTGTHDDSDSQVAAVLGDIPDFIASVIRPAVEHVLNLGRVHEITPGAKEDELKDIGAAWRAAGEAALKTADGLTRSIDYITDGRNSEWQGAMRSFCQSIWGTTAWGKERHGHNWRTDKSTSPSGRRPIVQVLNKTALAVEAACNDVGTAIVETKEKTTRLGKEAAWATAKDLSIDLDFWELTRLTSPLAFTEIVMTFRSHMDSAAVNAAVDAYHAVCRGAADDILKFLPELDEAYLSAPTFRAEEARAQAFGARSLNEFKKEHSYTVPNGAKENHFYAIDLAGQEDLHGSHVIDKHVGKTDEQLAQRLRDQQLIRNGAVRPEAASSFKDLQSAQHFTQEAMDDITNAQKIENWVANQEGRPVENPRSTLTIKHTFNESTGHTVTRDEYDANGINAPAADTHSVQVVLRYKRGIDPPFVVLTSMPTTP